VRLEGLNGDVKKNVEASLSILNPGKDPSASSIRRLHARAESEIRMAMEPFGYYAPVIRDTLIEEGDDFHADYRVTPGDPIHVALVDIQVDGPGEQDEGFQELLKSFPVRSGDVLDHGVYTQAKIGFQARAAEQGYLDAAFDSSAILIDLAAYRASIVLHFATGIRSRFGDVRLHQDVLKPEMVQGYVEIHSGDPYELNRLLALQANLARGPYFSTVEVHTRRNEAADDRVPIDVDLVPARPRRYEVGAGYGTDTGIRGHFGVDLRRLNRRGHYAEADLEMSQREITVSSRYVIPWPYPRTEELSFFGGVGGFDPGWSNSFRFTGGASLSRMRGSWREIVSLGYEHDDWTIGDTDGVSGLLLLSGSWTQTRTDDRFDPSNGQSLRLEVKGAHDAVLSSASMLQGNAEAKMLRHLAGPMRALVRASVGGTASPEFAELPPSQRFVTGGTTTVRGFSYQSLGPRDAGGDLVGGNLMATGSAELEARVFHKFGVAGFIDTGNAFADTWKTFEVGTGVGLRWVSPVGLLRLDGAWGVSWGSDPFQIHFVIGPVF
jgi:translocation and assembly module TamA